MINDNFKEINVPASAQKLVKKRLMLVDDHTKELDIYGEKFSKLGYDVIKVVALDATMAAHYLDESGHIRKKRITHDLPKAEPSLRSSLQALAKFDYGVYDTSHIAPLLEAIQPDILLTDQNLQFAPGKNFDPQQMAFGHALIHEARKTRPDMPMLIHSDRSATHIYNDAKKDRCDVPLENILQRGDQAACMAIHKRFTELLAQSLAK